MGSQDMFIDSQFKTTSDGRVLFYPFGSWGKGYILPNRKIEQEVRIKNTKFYRISLVANILTLPILLLSAINQSIP